MGVPIGTTKFCTVRNFCTWLCSVWNSIAFMLYSELLGSQTVRRRTFGRKKFVVPPYTPVLQDHTIIYRRLSRCKQLGGLVLVIRLGVPLRCKAGKLVYPLNIPPLYKNLFDSSKTLLFLLFVWLRIFPLLITSSVQQAILFMLLVRSSLMQNKI